MRSKSHITQISSATTNTQSEVSYNHLKNAAKMVSETPQFWSLKHHTSAIRHPRRTHHIILHEASVNKRTQQLYNNVWYASNTHWQNLIVAILYAPLSRHFVVVPFTNALCRISVVYLTCRVSCCSYIVVPFVLKKLSCSCRGFRSFCVVASLMARCKSDSHCKSLKLLQFWTPGGDTTAQGQVMTSTYSGNRSCTWMQAMCTKHNVCCNFSHKCIYMHVRYSEYSTYSACTGFPHYSALHLVLFCYSALANYVFYFAQKS